MGILKASGNHCKTKSRKSFITLNHSSKQFLKLIASMSVCGLILGKRYQKVCPKMLVGDCVLAHNHTSPIDTLFSVEGRINFSQDDTAITEVFGTTTLGITNNIMFPLNIIISFVTAVKCIMDYFHDGPLKMTSDTKSGRAVISSAMLVYVFHPSAVRLD